MNWGLIAVTVLMTAVLTGSAAAQSAPRLEYGTPDGFYRLANDAPVQFDACDGDVRIHIFTFQPLRDDLAAHFGRTLLADAKLLGNGAIEIYGITFTHVPMQP